MKNVKIINCTPHDVVIIVDVIIFTSHIVNAQRKFIPRRESLDLEFTSHIVNAQLSSSSTSSFYFFYLHPT